jgi:hypothetical protein
MSEPVESLLIKEFFPNTRAEFNKHYPPTGGKKMTRDEHIASVRALITICCNYGRRAADEEVFVERPYLRSEVDFTKWEELEPFDRFVFLTCGLPWSDEIIALLKENDGVDQ